MANNTIYKEIYQVIDEHPDIIANIKKYLLNGFKPKQFYEAFLICFPVENADLLFKCRNRKRWVTCYLLNWFARKGIIHPEKDYTKKAEDRTWYWGKEFTFICKR